MSINEIEAQRVLKIGLVSDSTLSYRYPDSSNFLTSIFFGDTSGLSYYNSQSPDSLIIDKKHDLLKYRKYDGGFVECKITEKREPVEFGLTMQVFDLKYRSGMIGRLVILEMSELEKMILMEWNYNGFNYGFISQMTRNSALKLDPLLGHHRRNWIKKIRKSKVQSI